MENQMETRNRPKNGSFFGIPYTFNDPPFHQGNRLASDLLIKNPKTRKTIKTITVTGMTEEKLCNNRAKAISTFLDKDWGRICDLAKSGDYALMLQDYCVMRRDNILKVLKRKYTVAKFEFFWSDVLHRFQPVSVAYLYANPGSVEKSIVNMVDALFPRRKAKKAIDEFERLTWAFLDAVFTALKEDGFFESNPISALVSENYVLESTVASRAFRERSLSISDSRRYLSLVLTLKDYVIRTALLIRFLTGMTVYELCGLDLDSFLDKTKMCPAVITVIQRFYQVRGKAAQLLPLETWNSYRKFPCSRILRYILSGFVRFRKKEGAKPCDPLFIYEGTRLEPNTLKEYESRLLKSIFCDLPFDPVRADFIRTNAERHFIKTCDMTPRMSSYLLGVDREETYAKSYVDWKNALVLAYMSFMLDRWHNLLLSSTGKPITEEVNACGYFIMGSAKNGAKMKLVNQHGFELSTYK